MMMMRATLLSSTVTFILLCGGYATARTDEKHEPEAPRRHLSTEEGVIPYAEHEGLLVMEMESQPLVPDWVFETEVANYTGTGYYRMDGNRVDRGPPNGRVPFVIQIYYPGRYRLAIRSNKNNEDTTISNDCYTRMVGHPGYQGNDTKTYMFGPSDTWSWSTQHQLTHYDQRSPEYDLKSGVHVLEISGRSKNFSIDRVVLYHKAAVKRRLAQNLDVMESRRTDDATRTYVIMDYNFAENTGGLTFSSDLFKDTSAGFYTKGRWAFGSYRLRIDLGGKNGNLVEDISAGYHKNFTLIPETSRVFVTFRYRIVASGLDDDEYTEVLCSVDDTLYGQHSNYFVDRMAGGGNSGWRTSHVDVGSLPAGEHSFAVGAYLNKKNETGELVKIFIQDLATVAYATGPPTLYSPIVMDHSFENNLHDFVYVDNVFRGTKMGNYARHGNFGSYSTLRVVLGGKDDDVVRRISGGYVKSYTLPADAFDVVLTLRYRVIFDSVLETGENTQVLCSVNGVLYGVPGKPLDVVDVLWGSTSPKSTAWRSATIHLGKQNANTPYELAVGGMLTMKNSIDDVVKIWIDDLVLSAEY